MAYFTLSEKVVLEQFDRVRQEADVVSYSSKTNPEVTPLLEHSRADCLFSIHDERELVHVVEKRRVLFLAQGLSFVQLDRLFALGIDRFVLDNEQDLATLLSWLEQDASRRLRQVFLRVKLKEHTIKTEKYFVFGMSSSIVSKHLLSLRGHEQIEELGIHFHRKSQNVAEWNLQYELEQLFDQEVLDAVQVINIGGGLPAVYANTNEKIFTGIFQKIRVFREWLHQHRIALMIEPGRFIAAPAGELHTTIMLVYEQNIIVYASVYNSDMDALIVPVKLLVKGELTREDARDDSAVKPYVIKGRTPCSMDLFRYRVWLRSPKKGDELVFLNAGAYNFTTDFCDLEKLATKVVDEGVRSHE